MPLPVDPRVLVGHAGADDAGVYRLSDETALVLTTDFFTPIVDDPFDFGRVAAANSLSDVYAMGGQPLVALNIAGFPEGKVAPEVLGEILRGGAEMAREAGVAIVGGHTVNDAELKYGLAVVGTVHPDRVVTNAGARPGDALVLTKPLGTGALATALKREQLSSDGLARLTSVMTHLNREAAERMLARGVHAATDITGYGLLGHAHEMAEASGVTLQIDAARVPAIEGALEAVAAGHVPGGAHTNREFLAAPLRPPDRGRPARRPRARRRQKARERPAREPPAGRDRGRLRGARRVERRGALTFVN
jgi:selenide,water dikinase